MGQKSRQKILEKKGRSEKKVDFHAPPPFYTFLYRKSLSETLAIDARKTCGVCNGLCYRITGHYHNEKSIFFDQRITSTLQFS